MLSLNLIVRCHIVIGGFLIDKFDRKKIMIISDLFSSLALFILFIIYKNIGISLYVIYAIRFILSLMDVFFEPAAMSYIPKLVTAIELVSANSLSSVSLQVILNEVE